MNYNSKILNQSLKELFERYKMEEEDNPHIDKDGFCKYCRWNSAYNESHISYMFHNRRCEYIDSKYNVFITKDNELGFSKKSDTSIVPKVF